MTTVMTRRRSFGSCATRWLPRRRRAPSARRQTLSAQTQTPPSPAPAPWRACARSATSSAPPPSPPPARSPPSPTCRPHPRGFEMENGDETFSSPTAAAAKFKFDFRQGLTNGVGFNAQPAAKAYDAAEIDALREAKRDLEEKVAAVCHENHFLSVEARRLEMVVSKAREDAAAVAEHTTAASEGEAASLCAKVKHFQCLLATEKSDREGLGVGSELAGAHQEELALEEEIKALKACFFRCWGAFRPVSIVMELEAEF